MPVQFCNSKLELNRNEVHFLVYAGFDRAPHISEDRTGSFILTNLARPHETVGLSLAR